MRRKLIDLFYSTKFRRNLALAIPLVVALICAITWPPENTSPYIEPILAPIHGLEWGGYDTLFYWRGPTTPDPNIVIVGFESNTEVTLGQWPPPRAYHARVLDNLIQDGAKVVCFDILMDTPSARGVQDDKVMNAALSRAKGKVVMASHIDLGGADKLKKLLTPYHDPNGNPDDPNAIDFETNSIMAGVDITRERDEVVRTIYPLQKFQDEWLPALPAAAFAAVYHLDIQKSRLAPNKIFIGDHEIPRTGPTIPDTLYPVNVMGSSYVDFPGGSNIFPIYRYEDVYGGHFEKGLFKDKIVFIGVTDTELAIQQNDIFRTAYSSRLSEQVGANNTRQVFGVVVQAQMLNALLKNDFIRMASPVEIFLIVFLFSNLANYGVKFLNWRSPTLIAIAIMGFVAIVFTLFVQLHVYIPYVFPSALMLLGTAGAAWLERGEVVRKWSAYVSPAYMEFMLKNGEDFRAEKYNATVIFGDIRGFTNFSSHHPPEVVIDLLDKHLENQVKIVFEWEGTIDKFLGDGIMVVFGAPNKQPDKEIRAVRAAWEMRAASFQPIQDNDGNTYHLREGFGIATGPLVLGFVGSRQMYSLTTIGDTVNLSSRLQGVTGDADIVIDRATYEAVKEHVEVEELGAVQIKGKDEKIHCWRVTALKDASGG